MLRRIIQIDEQKCDGCGLCADACHEHAIEIIDGKARLVADDYCDGLGDCLPACPQDAISFIEREAKPYDQEAVRQRQLARQAERARQTADPLPCGCPGSQTRQLQRGQPRAETPAGHMPSELGQWPVQIKLAPINAGFYHGADLLIAADCCAFAYAATHRDFMRGKVTLIGCPKLDQVDYSEKLSAILAENDINSVTVLRMSVPCCGLDRVLEAAIAQSGKQLPLNTVIITPHGEIAEPR